MRPSDLRSILIRWTGKTAEHSAGDDPRMVQFVGWTYLPGDLPRESLSEPAGGIGEALRQNAPFHGFLGGGNRGPPGDATRVAADGGVNLTRRRDSDGIPGGPRISPIPALVFARRALLDCGGVGNMIAEHKEKAH